MPSLYDKVTTSKRPDWLKIKIAHNAQAGEVQRIVKEHGLHTICSSGLCPNRAECWSRRTATFMILGDICTRNCRFCATQGGTPLAVDTQEPERVAESVALMGLKYVVLTSVTRDDLADGGAEHWAATVRAVRERCGEVIIELLIPDFEAKSELLDIVIASGADVIGHNIECVERLTPEVRSVATYRRSLEVLRYLAERGATTKSGIMVGLGESEAEVVQTMRDLRGCGVSLLTIGQYLQPTLKHLEVAQWVKPELFEIYRQEALKMGFSHCASAPLVRSSYLAEEGYRCAEEDKDSRKVRNK